MKMPLNELENSILSALGGGSLSTKALANAVGANRSIVYNTCKRLETRGLLTSTKGQSDQRLFFFPLTGEILNSENYENIMQMIKESDDPDASVIPFYPEVRIWSLA